MSTPRCGPPKPQPSASGGRNPKNGHLAANVDELPEEQGSSVGACSAASLPRSASARQKAKYSRVVTVGRENATMPAYVPVPSPGDRRLVRLQGVRDEHRLITDPLDVAREEGGQEAERAEHEDERAVLPEPGPDHGGDRRPKRVTRTVIPGAMGPARWLAFLGAVNAFLAVAAGAFGAHALQGRLDARLQAVFETAVRYHLLHALGMFAASWLCTRGAALSPAGGWLMQAGIVLFSGSLYALALSGVRGFGAITPVGGLCFLAGWACLAFSAWRGPWLR